MALSVTVAEVLAGTNAVVDRDKNAGETLTAGQCVYLSAAGTWLKAQSDGTAVEAGSLGLGFALHASLTGQPVAVQTGGIFTIGATAAPVVGTIYVVSATAGSVDAWAALVTTNKITILGICSTAGNIDMSIRKYTGYAIP